ncbi:MAG: hypothetical protein PHE55_07060 [Methylococcaceae bacterium]|nr:hypothetical protein [Methylococcaceae bacterium]
MRRYVTQWMVLKVSRFWALAAMLSISACSFFPDRPPTPALHDFGSGERFLARETLAWSKVKVEAPDWLQNEHIRYRLLYADPSRVRFYAQDRWLAPPPSLLEQQLSMAGGGSGYRMKIRLLEFEQVFDQPQSARAILAFRASAERSDGGEVAGERAFRFELPASSADAKGAVTAAANLIDKAVDSLVTWLSQLPPRP